MTMQDNEKAGNIPQATAEENFGSARSDYGKNAYGGDLNAQGMQSESSQDEKRGPNGASQQSEHENQSKGLSSGLLLLGAGVSTALLYMLWPGRKTGTHTVKQGEFLQTKCRDLMTVNPSCCLPEDSVAKAAQLMKTENVGAIPVIEDLQTQKLIGILTDRDLALKVIAERRNSDNTTVADVMTRGVTVCHAGDELQTVLNKMGGQQLRRIPVVDDNNRIVGIIAQADIATRLEAPKATSEVVEEISKATAAGS